MTTFLGTLTAGLLTTGLLVLVLPIPGVPPAALLEPAAAQELDGAQDEPAPAPDAGGLEDEAARAQLVEAMAQAGIRLDLEAEVVSIPATVQMRHEDLEYLLCTPRGQAHESLFLTEVSPTALNAALLALGLEPGKNARLVASELALDPGEINERGGPGAGELTAQAAASAPEVLSPSGDGLYMHVGWREEDETYFFRVDDLIINLSSGRTLRRHAWVFLGSRLVRPRVRAGQPTPPEVFAAEIEGNLINISFFFGGNTLVTAARPECIEQSIWVANSALLPPMSAPVEFFFATRPLESVPADWRESLPVVRRDPAGSEAGR